MSFTLDLTKAIENINKNTDKVVRGTLLGITRRIIMRTPVGNPSLWMSKPPAGYTGGSLRGSWQASVGTPELSDPKIKDNLGGPTINDANNTIKTMQIGQTYYLSSVLPYASAVEYGWSSQAPQGMVRTSVIETQQIIDSL